MYTYKAKIVRVIDADTLELEVDCGFRLKFRDRFRLEGVNAPELNTAEGQAAKQFVIGWVDELRNPVGDAVVTIETYKPDKYGRWLFSIVGREDGRQIGGSTSPLQTSLINNGHAVYYTV